MNWTLLAVLSAASAGLIPIVAKKGLEGIDSTLATTLRALVMAGCLLLASGVLGKFRQLPSVDRPAMLAILMSGLAGAASWFFYFMALRSGPAPKVAALDRTSVAFTLFLSALFLGEALNWKNLLGIGLIVLGAILTLKS
jgi:transporter family protein